MNLRKVTMNLSERDVINTDKLKERMHARSKAEAISNALSVTVSLSEMLDEGGELLIRGSDGVLERIKITALD